MLTMTKCRKCGGHFVTHPHEIARHYVCGLCNPPARAGKGKPAVQRSLDNHDAEPAGDLRTGMGLHLCPRGGAFVPAAGGH